jgi:hypothetical protein
MRAGEWLDGWEMYCSADVEGVGFGVRGEFLDGAIDGCEATAGAGAMPVPDDGTGIVAWNPDGDKMRLAVAWRDDRCTDGATVSVLPSFDRYMVDVISIAGACRDSPSERSAVFHFTTPVEAQDVTTTLQFAGP